MALLSHDARVTDFTGLCGFFEETHKGEDEADSSVSSTGPNRDLYSLR